MKTLGESYKALKKVRRMLGLPASDAYMMFLSHPYEIANQPTFFCHHEDRYCRRHNSAVIKRKVISDLNRFLKSIHSEKARDTGAVR